jgi:hypothetical protein
MSGKEGAVSFSLQRWHGIILKIRLFAFALLASVLSASPNSFAQQPPSAGGQLLQLPPPPILREAAPEIQIEQGVT